MRKLPKLILCFIGWFVAWTIIYVLAHSYSWKSFLSMSIGYYLLIYVLSSLLVVPVAVIFWEEWEEGRKRKKDEWEIEKSRLDYQRLKDEFIHEHQAQFERWRKSR